MIVRNENEMFKLGKKLGKEIRPPYCIELRGDVGAGKTTFTQGIADGLGVRETVTSPSFLISKRYAFPKGELVHYDFYRLEEPGLMAEELDDSLSDPGTIVIVEWGGEVEGVLPENRKIIEIKALENGDREVKW